MDIYNLVNGKVRCTAIRGDGNSFTVGKIYDVVDRKITGDTGFNFGEGSCRNAIEWLKPFYQFELVTDNESNIEKVIFTDPATIILWNDGTKTVAKCCEDDKYDAEKGFCIAYLKKMLGNSKFSEELHKWVDDEDKPLTIEELKAMDGEYVWLSSLDEHYNENFINGYTGWYKVDVSRNRLEKNDRSWYFLTELGIANAFKAYRKPPKKSRIKEDSKPQKKNEAKEDTPYKTKPPFSVGDKVKIVDHPNWWWCELGGMNKYMNKILTIEGTRFYNGFIMKECPEWSWSEEDFVQE